MKKVLKMCVLIAAMMLSAFISAPTVMADNLKTLVADTPGNVIEGKAGWLFLKEELEHMAAGPFWGEAAGAASKTTKKEFADPVPAIVDFNKQLHELGVELLFVPIPPKALIYGENLPGDFSEDLNGVNENYDSFFKILADQGVHVLDMREAFHDQKSKQQLYCATDTHYSGAGLKLVADSLAKTVAAAKWSSDIPRKEYVTQERSISIKGDLAVMAELDREERLLLDFVTVSDTGGGVTADPASPLLLLGDSHTLVYSTGGEMHAKGAGLLENLVGKTGFPIDLLGVRGSGATPARIKLYQQNRRNPEYMATKKMVIWCLTARELTGAGGWRKVPVVPVKK